MAAFYDETQHLVISDNEARGGVTGHNVRYVLAFGMTGVILAFAAIALYFGYDAIQARLSVALSSHPSEIVRFLAPYGASVLFGAIGGGLALGIWNMVAGRSADDSERFMRLRVVTQFALICVIMAMLYAAQS